MVEAKAGDTQHPQGAMLEGTVGNSRCHRIAITAPLSADTNPPRPDQHAHLLIQKCKGASLPHWSLGEDLSLRGRWSTALQRNSTSGSLP